MSKLLVKNQQASEIVKNKLVVDFNNNELSFKDVLAISRYGYSKSLWEFNCKS